MFRYIARVCGAAVASVVLAAVGIMGAGASAVPLQPAKAAASPGPSHLAAGPGTQLWVRLYDSPDSADVAGSVAVSPSGKTVYVTGTIGVAGGYDYGTVAYNATTGARVWVERYSGPSDYDGKAESVAVSPSGKTVYVTGTIIWRSDTEHQDFATIAYNAGTGARLWVKIYNGPDNVGDAAFSMAVSPSGNTVFVSGTTDGTTLGGPAYATIAYNAATGAQLWVTIYDGPVITTSGLYAEIPYSMAVSPSGKTVFVTGQGIYSGKPSTVTIAYSAATGAQLWIKPYSNTEPISALAVSPSGKTVFVTGSYLGGTWPADVTVAYNAITGAQLWVKRYAPKIGSDEAYSVAVSPSGKTVFVTGGFSGSEAYGTIAYNAATGAQLWVKRYAPGGTNFARSVAVSPSGKTVYVTGYADTYFATVAYNAATGAQLWVKRYSTSLTPSTSTAPGGAYAMAVSDKTGAVFVTGTVRAFTAAGALYVYTTIAYNG